MIESAVSGVHIRIPAALRPYSDGAAEAVVQAGSVNEALAGLLRVHPGLTGLILDERGEVRRHINIFRDQDEIRTLQGAATPLLPGGTLTILPAISGGSN